MDSEKPEIKIAIIGGRSDIRKALTRALIKIHGNTKIICDDAYEGSILSNIEKLKNEPLPKFDSSPRFCDCLNCRLGKINQCQTFRPSKKGECK